jgi:TonB-linked SusC/RagA family outer membrane protein
MNRIESITILKDAAAKALYGSKAANGVVVIETRRLSGTEQRVTYTGNMTLEMPDLTSYNLTNAAEKLEAERLDGVYTSAHGPNIQTDLWNLYNERKKRILEGLDTYWLSKPLRTGVGQKHGLSVEVGDSRNLRTVLDVSYNQVNGVMKGSYRNTITGNVNVSYRMKNFLFRDVMSVTSMKNEESPYGSFSKYAEMNPYLYATNPETGTVTRWAEVSTFTPNPIYDAMIGTLNKESYLDFVNNFYAEWQLNEHFKATGRLGISSKRSDWEEFLPADHSTFSTLEYREGTYELKLRRGSYQLENGKGGSVSADVNLNYNRSIEKHDLFFNAGAFISENTSKSYRNKAEGFPGNMGADITFARQYAQDSRPVGSTTIKREISFLGVASYSYANRYLTELTARVGGSSLYGKDNRWSSGWGIGVSWNLHNENFLVGSKIERLKLRASLGVTSSQNFNTNESIATYTYYTDDLYQTMVGSYLMALANPGLGWERKQDYNVGLDFQTGAVTAVIEWYKGVTHDALADVVPVQSTGFSTVKDNLGLVSNTGVELTLGYTAIRRKDCFLNLFGSIVTEKNILERVSDAMRAFNEAREQMAALRDNPKPVLMYKDGQAMRTIWAVPSLGIDPMNGYEIYVKQDGSLTYDYDPLDLIAAGDESPKYRGNVGFTAHYKGIELSVTCRYLGGGEMYNSTLVDRVENVDMSKNVDRRVLSGRWMKPGDQVQFKRLDTFMDLDNTKVRAERTRATTRFVQKRNEFDLSALSLSYEMPSSVLQKLSVERLKLSFYMNDVAKWSSIRIERGLSYPYSHVASFSLMATF